MIRYCAIAILVLGGTIFGVCGQLDAAGAIEIEAVVTSWSLNLFRPFIEEKAGDWLDDTLQEEILDEIRRTYPNLAITHYEQTIQFDSSGSNLGLRLRFYPNPESRGFSLSLMVSKATMRLGFPNTDVRMDLAAQSDPPITGVFVGTARMTPTVLKPVCFVFGLNWDIAPQATFHPYLALGLGIFASSAVKDAIIKGDYSGVLTVAGGQTESISGGVEKTVQQLLDESDEEIQIPGVLPILQLNIGAKLRLSETIQLFADVGFFNGITLGGGVAIGI